MDNNTPVIVSNGDTTLIWAAEAAQFWRPLASGTTRIDQPHVTPGHLTGWLIAEGPPPETLSWVTEHSASTGTATLKKPELNSVDLDRWPLTIDTDDLWEEDSPYRSEDYEIGVEREMRTTVVDLAGAVRVDRAATPELPDQEVVRRWKVDFEHAVLRDAKLHPWFPGQLTGFRAHMAHRVAGNANVTDVYCEGAGRGERNVHDYEGADGPYFLVRLWWSDGRGTTVKKKVGRKTTEVKTGQWETERVSLKPVPLSIPGVDLWDALANWETAEAEWLAQWEIIGAKACGHCDGRGWVRSDKAG